MPDATLKLMAGLVSVHGPCFGTTQAIHVHATLPATAVPLLRELAAESCLQNPSKTTGPADSHRVVMKP